MWSKRWPRRKGLYAVLYPTGAGELVTLEKDDASYVLDAFDDRHEAQAFTEAGALFHPLQDRPTFGVTVG